MYWVNYIHTEKWIRNDKINKFPIFANQFTSLLNATRERELLSKSHISHFQLFSSLDHVLAEIKYSNVNCGWIRERERGKNFHFNYFFMIISQFYRFARNFNFIMNFALKKAVKSFN